MTVGASALDDVFLKLAHEEASRSDARVRSLRDDADLAQPCVPRPRAIVPIALYLVGARGMNDGQQIGGMPATVW